MVQDTPAHLAKIGDAAEVYVTCLVSVLIYDWLVCLPQEFRLFHQPFFRNGGWKRGSSIRSYFIYIIIRYLALIEFGLILGMIWTIWSQSECHRLFYWDSYVSAFVVATANLFLAFRTAAIWCNNRRVNIRLTLLWFAQVAILMWAAYYQTNNKSVPYCLAIQTSSNIVGLYAGPLAYDSIMLSLTIAKVLQVRKAGSFIGPNLRILVKDGVFYFIGVWICNLTATVTELQNIDPAAKAINASLATIGTSILCSRLALNTRDLIIRVQEKSDIEIGNVHSKQSSTVVDPQNSQGTLTEQKGVNISKHIAVQADLHKDSSSTSVSSIPLPRLQSAYMLP